MQVCKCTAALKSYKSNGKGAKRKKLHVGVEAASKNSRAPWRLMRPHFAEQLVSFRFLIEDQAIRCADQLSRLRSRGGRVRWVSALCRADI